MGGTARRLARPNIEPPLDDQQDEWIDGIDANLPALAPLADRLNPSKEKPASPIPRQPDEGAV